MRHKLGVLFMILGVLSIMSAAGLLVYNHWQDQKAGEASAQVLSEMEQLVLEQQAPQPDSPGQEHITLEMATREIDGHAYVGFLSMPTIQRELPVMAELEMSDLTIAPCRYYGSTYTDDLVIAAHNYEWHFAPISRLAPGDPVYFTDMNGIVNTYQVYSTETLQPTDIDLVKGGEGDLILFTCTYGGATRITVRCARAVNP